MGDVLTLIEQAERAFDEDQATKMAGKLASGDGFTLEDFVEQMQQVRKLGPIGESCWACCPGCRAEPRAAEPGRVTRTWTGPLASSTR